MTDSVSPARAHEPAEEAGNTLDPADHPDPGTTTGRVWACLRLMAEKRWVRGVTGVQLAEFWGVSKASMRDYAAQASRWLAALGERDDVLAIVRAHTAQRLAGADDAPFVPLARLLIDTVGGVTQKHEVEHRIAGMSDAEVYGHVVRELAGKEEGRELMRAALAEWDARPVALLAEGTEVADA